MPAYLRCPDAVSDALTSSLDLPTTLFRALRSFGAAGMAADGVFVNVLRPEALQVEFLAGATRSGGERMTAVVPVTEETLRLRPKRSEEISVVRSLAEDPFTARVAPVCFPAMRSFLMMRLAIESRHLGVVCFWSSREGAFTERDRAMLESVRTLFSLHVGFALTERLRETNERLASENRSLAQALGEEAPEPELARLLANSPSFGTLTARLRQAARFDAPVLVMGESGTGKEVVAQTIHAVSARRGRPFVRVNCSAIPEALLESEFFGHEEGAFTGASRRHAGYFEAADGGTLFLDEIGELPAPMQAKLLHALQNRTVRRVGGSEEIPVDVRIIAATNRDLEMLVRTRHFRLDLYYRLNVLPLHIPPLRERPADIEPLLRHFVRELARDFGLKTVPEVSPEAVRAAEGKYWPGNVRQLKNVVMRTLMRTPDRIRTLDFSGDEERSFEWAERSSEDLRQEGRTAAEKEAAPEPQTFEEAQRRYFESLLARTGGKISGPQGAAALSGLPVSTLRSRLRRLGFERFANS